MARRFIVEASDMKRINASDNIMEISGKEVKHIQVLRHQVGERIVINEYVCEILEMKKNSIVIEIVAMAEKVGEPKVPVTLYIAMLKGEKMDLVVQKAVELGVKNIVPFFCNNTVVKLDEKGKIKRQTKLQMIADEACKQCGRTDRVVVVDIITFKELLLKMAKKVLTILAYEKETAPLREVLEQIKKIDSLQEVAMIIGPEGGFDEVEIHQLRSFEWIECVSLGSRILRAETAVFHLLSIMMYELEG